MRFHIAGLIRLACRPPRPLLRAPDPCHRAYLVTEIDHGSGYRVYFMQRGKRVVVLLAGGDKRTQDFDIKRAIEIAKDWKE
ncbi:MAG: type II toxin-antitoxin system RelE/ParE family toxin [Sulfuricellaceae bacterium]|nr:type II toxin-antitoxin system RelE/ParE family toxin [Sulfuricellaceae bacterium]